MSVLLRKISLGIVAMVLVASVAGAQGQQSRLRAAMTPLVSLPIPQDSLEEELRMMTQQAAVIFAGRVLAVRPQSSMGMAIGWVETEFQVEQAIRGCAGQGVYVLREWAGLWTGGLQRYRVGQEFLMLLHAPSASGLSSPVSGQDGAIPLTGTGAAPGPGDSSAVLNEQGVDVRWLEARLLRTPSMGQRLHARPLQSSDTLPVSRVRGERRSLVDGVRTNNRFEANRIVGGGFESAEEAVEGTINVAGFANQQPLTLRSVLVLMGAWETHQVNGTR